MCNLQSRSMSYVKRRRKRRQNCTNSGPLEAKQAISWHNPYSRHETLRKDEGGSRCQTGARVRRRCTEGRKFLVSHDGPVTFSEILLTRLAQQELEQRLGDPPPRLPQTSHRLAAAILVKGDKSFAATQIQIKKRAYTRSPRRCSKRRKRKYLVLRVRLEPTSWTHKRHCHKLIPVSLWGVVMKVHCSANLTTAPLRKCSLFQNITILFEGGGALRNVMRP